MKRTYSYSSEELSSFLSEHDRDSFGIGDEDEDASSFGGGGNDNNDELQLQIGTGTSPSSPPPEIFQLAPGKMARDDRPCLLPPPPSDNEDVDVAPQYFEYLPRSMQVDPLATGTMVGDVSAHGCTLATLEYNLKLAVERRDEARTAVCLTEFFRHFVLVNRPMRRYVSASLERQTRLELMQCIGPFANPASLGMHQRLLSALLGICVRQVGVATPLAFSSLLEGWKGYEDALFHQPVLALSKLLGLGALLCHCKKDASVAYARHVFEDTSKMRDWRNEALKHPDVLATYIPSSDQALRARKMLLCNKVYFDNRLRLRRYQTVCIGTPHPEYMCQGGPMQRAQVRKLVDTLRQGLPSSAGPSVLVVIQDIEDAMVYLASHVHNLFDRDAWDVLQVDLQIFLYLFQKVLCEPGMCSGPDSLMETCQSVLACAPVHVGEAFAGRLWLARPDTADLIRYGVAGEPLIKAGRGAKKRAITINDLVDSFHPPIIPKVHLHAPPSIERDEDNIPRECRQSEIQRHPGLGCIRFLFALYRLHHLWGKCAPSKSRSGLGLGLGTGTGSGTGSSRVVVDREFFDATQPCKVLYQCRQSGVCAAEIVLQGNAVAEFQAEASASAAAAAAGKCTTETVHTTDPDEAVVLVDYLKGYDGDSEGQEQTHGIKAVLIGPWNPHEASRLEQETRHFQELKEALGVQPDVVLVKKMMLLDFSTIIGDVAHPSHVVGRTYAWVVYIPCLAAAAKGSAEAASRVVLSIDELKEEAGLDVHLEQAVKSILRPTSFVRLLAIIRRTCLEHCNWTIGCNYASFGVRAEGKLVVLSDVRLHAVTDTLLSKYPHVDSATLWAAAAPTAAAPNACRRTTTHDIVTKLIDKCAGNSSYACASMELARCETILNQLSSSSSSVVSLRE